MSPKSSRTVINPRWLSAEGNQLVRDSAGDRWGRISTAVYDTAQVGCFVDIHMPRARDHLLAWQHSDGGWGPSRADIGYRLVPTLAATSSLLGWLAADPAPSWASSIGMAARRGLGFLIGHPGLSHPETLPDTVAVEHIVPAQLDIIGKRLAELPEPGERIRDGVLRARHGTKSWRRGLRRLREAVAHGAPLPPHLDHTLEVLGPRLAAEVAGGQVEGAVGCSPAATAAVLAGSSADRVGAASYLAAVARRHGGGQPNLAPIVMFELLWITRQLLWAGVTLAADLRTSIVSAVTEALNERGALGLAPGFPVDCDTTATGLSILHALGGPVKLSPLERFYSGSAFFCYYAGERTASPTVNAHVLTTLIELCGRDRRNTATGTWWRQAQRTAAAFLLDSQSPSGIWVDKWHASPYYAVSRCALAMANDGTPAALLACQRARDWVLATQRADGSWGQWEPSAEETAYALQTLVPTRSTVSTVSVRQQEARRRGLRWLLSRMTNLDYQVSNPPLWHGKELFTPHRIVLATVLAAAHRGLIDGSVGN